MDQEVLSQKRFAEFASKNLILVKLDFPRRKKLSANEKAQNDQLAKNTKSKASPPSSWSIPPAKKSGVKKGTLREDQPNSSSGPEATTSCRG
jgi:hypothetical protein